MLALGAVERSPQDWYVSRTDRARRHTPATYARRRVGALGAFGALVLAVVLLAPPGSTPPKAAASHVASARVRRAAREHVALARALRSHAAPIVTVPSVTGPGWTGLASVAGQPAAWIAKRSGVTLLRFDQAHVRVDLHAGSLDGGVAGWRYGDQIARGEIHRVIAGFNGGFKLTYPNVGFVAGGHVAVPLKSGLASIVTYSSGSTDIGVWGAGLPQSGTSVYSVLQNQSLLVDNGVAASTVSSCITTCWGATIQGLTTVARSALGVTASGELVWAAGEQLTPAALADALIGAGAVRAVELDINPDWVAGYAYVHRAGGPVAIPLVPGQLGIAGQLLAPDSRDFLTVVAR